MKKLLLILSLTLLALVTLTISGNSQASGNSPTRSVNFAWNPSPDIDISGYNFYYRSTSNATNEWQKKSITGANGTNTSLITTNYIQYEYFVTAVNTTGLESDPSNKIKTYGLLVNGNGKSTLITLIDNITANIPSFQLFSAPKNGTVSGTPPNITYNPTNSFTNDTITYISPEPWTGGDVKCYYMVYKVQNTPPSILSAKPQ